MIRLFTKICKYFKQNFSENEINQFHQYIDSINIASLSCPLCGAKEALSYFASYDRHLITYDNEEVCDHMVIIPRYICSSCGHTHAILPPVIVPYLSFSFNFIVNIIHDYLVRKFNSVAVMCQNYGIAISTFYRIFKSFKEHKKLWLGLLEDKLTEDLFFIQDLKHSPFTKIEKFIKDFFTQMGLSFFQGTS